MSEVKFRLPTIDPQFGIAMFPCLKTSASIAIGGYTFRPTTDLSGLPDEQATIASRVMG